MRIPRVPLRVIACASPISTRALYVYRGISPFSPVTCFVRRQRFTRPLKRLRTPSLSGR
jgi:hypothetical protein